MPSNHIEITYFYFGAIVEEGDDCEGDMRNGVVSMRHVDQTGNKQLAGSSETPQPPSVPPANEPDTTTARDLIGMGWHPRYRPGDWAHQDRKLVFQPAAMGRAGIYQSLNMHFTSAFLCFCRSNNTRCNLRQVYFSLTYDGTHHPTVVARQSRQRPRDEAGSITSDPPADIPPAGYSNAPKEATPADEAGMRRAIEQYLRDNAGDRTEEWRRQQLERMHEQIKRPSDAANTDANGTHTVKFHFPVEVDCPCTHEETDEKSGETTTVRTKCRVRLVVEYNYRNVLR